MKVKYLVLNTICSSAYSLKMYLEKKQQHYYIKYWFVGTAGQINDSSFDVHVDSTKKEQLLLKYTQNYISWINLGQFLNINDVLECYYVNIYEEEIGSIFSIIILFNIKYFVYNLLHTSCK